MVVARTCFRALSASSVAVVILANRYVSNMAVPLGQEVFE